MVDSTVSLPLLAEPVRQVGATGRGASVLPRPADVIEMTQEHLRGPKCTESGVKLVVGADNAAGEVITPTLTVARTNSTKLCEVRASTSLARLWRDQGKRDEARGFSRRSTAGSPKASTRSI